MDGIISDPLARAMIALGGEEPRARDAAIKELDKVAQSASRRVAAVFRQSLLDSDDLAQAVRVRLLDLAENYRHDPNKPAAALVACVARRAAIAEATKLARQRSLGTCSFDSQVFRSGDRGGLYSVGDVIEDIDAPDPSNVAADTIDAGLAMAILNEHLSSFERAVWIRLHVHQETYEEVAAHLSIGRKRRCDFRAIDNAVQRIRKKLSRFQRVRRIQEDECRIRWERINREGN